MTTIYLAGPDVFLAKAIEMGQAKKELCARYDFEGLFPLDAELAQTRTTDLSTRIFDANMEALARCDAVVANLTPFRGVSADVGTVFEVAYAYALGKPVFAYSNAAENLRDRVSSALGLKPPVAGQENREFASDGMEVENFNLADNLMIVEAIRRQGRDIVTPAASVADPLGDLAAFEECLRRARIYFIELKSSAAA